MSNAQTIELSVRIAAPPETVFLFFRDPQRFTLWMGEQSTMTPGPKGRLTVSYGPGPTAIGRIVEWVEPQRIVFEWSHEGCDAKPSRVTVTFRELAGSTEVTLRHEGIVETALREGTASGWRYYLSALTSVVLAERLSEAAPKAIATYLAAWSQADADRRLAELIKCITPDIRFRDRYGSIDGCEALNQYIGGVQKMMGTARLAAEGPPDRVHSFFRQNWVVQADGPVGTLRGQNIYEFADDCRIKLVIGFWA